MATAEQPSSESSPGPYNLRNRKSDMNSHGDQANGSNRESSKIARVSESHGSAWNNYLNCTIIPIVLLILMPNAILTVWYTAIHCNGSVLQLLQLFWSLGPLMVLSKMWASVSIGSQLSLLIIGGYCIWAVLLMVLLPGPTTTGPLTPKGNTPIYTDNGFYCYIVSMIALLILTIGLKSMDLTPTIVYDHFGDLIATMNLVSLVFCLFLCIKGHFYPSTTDSGTTGNFIFDYYWGTELYPRIFGIDVKVFTNCRFGLTVWPLLVVIFAVKSYELHGFVDSMWVSCILQLVYLTKFFWWEAGYMRTIDIMLDRAGYYICWGCLVWVTGFYTSVSLYLVKHPVHLGPVWSVVILFCGLLSIAINYLADWQKQAVRNSDGNCVVWGKKPEVIRAKYKLESGEERESLLLVSGYWGVARHFHYLPELMLSLCWSLPGGAENLMPYMYFIFLIILLVHRTYRDDLKCSTKYTTYWQQYCARVPYKIIPGIF